MLATFVIGLREGLEAALIVGIIAAFLNQSNRTDALRKVWIGVGAAVLLCLAVGFGLQAFSASLPQRQQEMLEAVVAAIAVIMITYMVLWMRAHSRSLRTDLQHATGSALASGSAGALVAMAFLAVIREGFETSVFLLAAFQSALSPLEAAIGVFLGIGVAVALGYLVYRGGVKLNLSKFFRITGVVLVLVAAGLVMSALRGAYEAGWITVGQQTFVDLSAVARPGSILESLLTGMLGIRSTLPVVEVVAYLLYAVPMLLVVLWPPQRTPSRVVLGRTLVGAAAASLVVAGLLAAFAPAAPGAVVAGQGPFSVQGSALSGIDPNTGVSTDGAVVTGTVQVTIAADAATAQISAVLAGTTVAGTTSLSSTGHADIPVAAGVTVSATTLAGTPVTAPVDGVAAGLPSTLTAGQIADLNGGRLPVGVRAQDQAFEVTYTDTVFPTVNADSGTGVILGVELRLVRTALVSVPTRGPVAAGTVLEAAVTADSAGAAGAAQVAELADQRIAHQVFGQVIPAVLVVFSLVLMAFGLPKLFGQQRPPPAGGAVEPRPSDGGHGASGPPTGPGADGLAKSGTVHPAG